MEIALEKEIKTTISELQGLLRVSPEIFGDQLQTIQEAVEGAVVEIRERGRLSRGTAEYLDNLYRPFKHDFIK